MKLFNFLHDIVLNRLSCFCFFNSVIFIKNINSWERPELSHQRSTFWKSLVGYLFEYALRYKFLFAGRLLELMTSFLVFFHIQILQIWIFKAVIIVINDKLIIIDIRTLEGFWYFKLFSFFFELQDVTL